MDRAERLRQVLSARGLTLYRVSQRSAEIFGRSSQFYVPHNLYSDLARPGPLPTLHQLFAFSRITNYLLPDWLSVFGFDLDAIPRLQLSVPRQRTTLLDSAVYDAYAWVPWFSERRREGPEPPIAPLGQLLAPGSPRRASDLLGLDRRGFLYAKIGQEDVHAFPHFAPGSIVRVDARRSEPISSETQCHAGRRFFFVEHDSGCTCSKLVLLSKDRIMLHSHACPSAQRELRLGKEARILGMVDAEFRRVTDHRSVPTPLRFAGLFQPPPRYAPNRQADLKNLLRNSRLRAGLSFREASSISRWIARVLSDKLYFTAASTLSDYETLSAPPRHIHKIITLCVLYSIDFRQFLRTSGLPLDQAGQEPIPDQLIPRDAPSRSRELHLAGEEESSQEENSFLGAILKQWEEVPLFLRRSLSELTGLKNFSLSDVFWVGGEKTPLHPWLINATFVAVNRRVKKPAHPSTRALFPQPLYLILQRGGSYLCGPCTLHQGQLIVHAYPGRPVPTRQFRNGTDAEIIGEVTAILRRLP